MVYDSNYILDQVKRQLKDDEKMPVDEKKDVEKMLSEEKFQSVLDFNSKPFEMLASAFSDLRLKLAEHMKLDKVLFFFGNGASMYAGSRNTKSFSLSDYTEKTEYADIKGIIQDVAKLRGIEEQLNAFITIRAYHRIVADTEKEGAFTKLIDSIKGNLIENFVNSVDYRNLNYHETFLWKLRNFGCLPRTSIYTPNYDLAFEYSLDKLGIEYNDGFSGFVNRQFDPRTLSARNRTSLVKVHGSVNWITTEDGIIKELQPRFNKDGEVEIDKTDSVLIYPTSNKLYQTYASPYSELMRHMLNEMETGRNVVLILGYKYGDDHINDILFKALRNPCNIFYFFLRSPNEQGEFMKRISELEKSMPNIHILTGKILASFYVFVTHMLPGMPEKTDEEKVMDAFREMLVGYAK